MTRPEYLPILKAFEILRAKQIKPTEVNIKFLFEAFEEEAGSPHLREIISANKDLLKADAFIVCLTGRYINRGESRSYLAFAV